MRVEMHDHLTNPVALPATRLLITDDQGTPICLCIEVVPGHNRVFRVGDSDFNDQMRKHGINRTTVAKTIEPQKLVMGRR